ncbi:hypothetical protein KGY73_08795 [bacterium]|nr:hypothetical protein [bacterium]
MGSWGEELKNLGGKISEMNEKRRNYQRQLDQDSYRKRSDWNKQRIRTKRERMDKIKEEKKRQRESVEEIKDFTQDFLRNYREKELTEMRKDNSQRAQKVDGFRKEVQSLIKEFRRERKRGAAAWKDLVSKLD